MTELQLEPQQPSLKESVERSMQHFLKPSEGKAASNIYQQVISDIEAPMLKVLLEHNRHNQTKYAQMLGINRGTFRNKLKKYALL